MHKTSATGICINSSYLSSFLYISAVATYSLPNIPAIVAQLFSSAAEQPSPAPPTRDHCAVTARRYTFIGRPAVDKRHQNSILWKPLSLRTSTRMAVGTDLRPVQLVVPGTHVSDGAGMPICRTVGTPALRNLDPYLMLDELKAPAHLATAGFPDHPHRGFETCSIMLEGKMEHQDSVGNKEGGVRVRVMAGSHRGTTGPIEMRNPGLLMDVTLTEGSTFKQEVPRNWNGFVYVCAGSGRICGTQGSCQHALVFGPGDHVTATTTDEQGLRFLLVAGQPIGEPVVQYGPFVMNTKTEVRQAFADYESGELQFGRSLCDEEYST
ncbi:hypothetical protein ABBQ32_011831 [Trebouxia sp. C0010 RCD-2024]